jgi:imidazoleglycerol-phosphate dehydratase
MAESQRKTFETEISVSLNLDGKGKSEIETGIGFFDHMLILFSKHGLFDLKVSCKGDLFIDGHHTVEDIGITLGSVFKEALGGKEGIVRYAHTFTPMDEVLTLVAVDLGGRPFLSIDAEYSRDYIGEFDTELVEEFFRGFINSAGINLHIKLMTPGNAHHVVESIFKGFGRALDLATKKDDRIEGVMSTKGVI